MNFNFMLIDKMQKENQLPVYELINHSGILNECSKEDIPVLMNAISFIKESTTNSMLDKIKEAVK